VEKKTGRIDAENHGRKVCATAEESNLCDRGQEGSGQRATCCGKKTGGEEGGGKGVSMTCHGASQSSHKELCLKRGQ